MDQAYKEQLRALLLKRWDPRRGISRHLGAYRYALGILTGVLYVGLFVIPVHKGIFSLFWLVPASGLVSIWLATRAIRIRTRAKVRKHGGFLCPWCRYALTDLPDGGQCPECGSGYIKDNCCKLYQAAYRGYQPDPMIHQRREKWYWARALRERNRAVNPPTPQAV